MARRGKGRARGIATGARIIPLDAEPVDAEPPHRTATSVGLRLAIEDLTALVSDRTGDTDGLADALWSQFVVRLGAGAGPETGRELGERLLGYRRVCLVLIEQLAQARGLTPLDLLQELATVLPV